MTERIYGLRELTRILTLTPRRAAQLKRLDLLHGKSGYTFRELLALRAAAALLDAGASVRQIRDALGALKRKDPTVRHPLAEMRLVLEGSASRRVRPGLPSTRARGRPCSTWTPATSRRPRRPTLVTGLVRPLHRGGAGGDVVRAGQRGTPTPRSGKTPDDAYRRVWRSIRAMRPPGTTSACCFTGSAATTRRAGLWRPSSKARRARRRHTTSAR